jgi:hypothetical protein
MACDLQRAISSHLPFAALSLGTCHVCGMSLEMVSALRRCHPSSPNASVANQEPWCSQDNKREGTAPRHWGTETPQQGVCPMTPWPFTPFANPVFADQETWCTQDSK